MNDKTTYRLIRNVFPWTFPLCIYVCLSLYRLGSKSFWLDEALIFRIAKMNWVDMWRTLTTIEPYRWLYYSIFHFWVKFNSSEAYLRALSVVFGTLSIPGIYALGKRMFSSSVGKYSAYLLAFHPMFIRYSQEVHSYSLLVSLTIWSSYFYILFVKKYSLLILLSYVISTILLIYSHHFGLLVFVVQGLGVLGIFQRLGLMKQYAGAVVCIILGVLPMFVHLIPAQNISWIPLPSINDIELYAAQLFGTNIIGFGLGMVIILAAAIRCSADSSRRSYMYVVCWLIVPPFIVIIGSYSVAPMFVSRYLIISLPAAILLLSVSIHRLFSRKGFVVLVIFLLILVIGVFNWYYAFSGNGMLGYVPFTDQEDWRGAASYIHERGMPKDYIVFYAYYTQYAYEYYARWVTGSPKIVQLSPVPFSIGGVMPEPNLSILDRIASSHRRLWLVLSHNWNEKLGRDAQTQAILSVLNAKYQKLFRNDYLGVSVLLYEP